MFSSNKQMMHVIVLASWRNDEFALLNWVPTSWSQGWGSLSVKWELQILGEMGLAQRGPEEEGRSLGKTCVRRKHFEKSQGTLRMVGSQRQGIGRTGTEERRREPHSFWGRKMGEWGFYIFCLLALEPFALINILFSFRLVCFVGWPHCSQSRSFWDENCVNFPHYCICSPGSSVGHRVGR